VEPSLVSREDVLLILGIYYLVSILIVDVLSAATAIFTQLTFHEFGRESTAKRLINDGLIFTATAWTLFLIGILPSTVNPLDIGERSVCLLVAILYKAIGQAMQATGWFRFWMALRAIFWEPA
jgi:hypothetical protein